LSGRNVDPAQALQEKKAVSWRIWVGSVMASGRSPFCPEVAPK